MMVGPTPGGLLRKNGLLLPGLSGLLSGCGSTGGVGSGGQSGEERYTPVGIVLLEDKPLAASRRKCPNPEMVSATTIAYI